MTIFERILQQQLPASFVYQDERCAAFLDIRPITRGHTLVVPRQAVATLDELEPDTRAHLLEVALRIGRAQRAALGSRAQHLLVNDGRAASQTVPHVHLHVIPRYGDDHLRTLAHMLWHVATVVLPVRETPRRRQALDQVASAIAAQLQPPPADR